jgi:hypothetical protein
VFRAACSDNVPCERTPILEITVPVHGELPPEYIPRTSGLNGTRFLGVCRLRMREGSAPPAQHPFYVCSRLEEDHNEDNRTLGVYRIFYLLVLSQMVLSHPHSTIPHSHSSNFTICIHYFSSLHQKLSKHAVHPLHRCPGHGARVRAPSRGPWTYVTFIIIQSTQSNLTMKKCAATTPTILREYSIQADQPPTRLV